MLLAGCVVLSKVFPFSSLTFFCKWIITFILNLLWELSMKYVIYWLTIISWGLMLCLHAVQNIFSSVKEVPLCHAKAHGWTSTSWRLFQSCWASILQGCRGCLSAPFMDTKWNKKYLNEKPFSRLNRMPQGECSSSSFNHTQTKPEVCLNLTYEAEG